MKEQCYEDETYFSWCSRQTVILRPDNNAANSASRAMGPGDVGASLPSEKTHSSRYRNVPPWRQRDLLANVNPFLSKTRTPVTSTPTMVNFSILNQTVDVRAFFYLRIFNTYAVSIKMSNFLSMFIWNEIAKSLPSALVFIRCSRTPIEY